MQTGLLCWRRHAGAALILVALLALSPAVVRADRINAAVAANFAGAAREIGAAFEHASGDHIVFSVGSTGQLYAQITQDAPFDVFLAADGERPEKTVTGGYAVRDSRFTYAVGKLVLFSKDARRTLDLSALAAGAFDRLAIANPLTAPYGVAAIETLRALELFEAMAPKLVRGNSVAQAYQFVETGNAELGFVALSQVVGHDLGARWVMPQNLYTPIAQDAVLLTRAANKEPARAFLRFLNSPPADAIKRRYGYGTDP